MKTLTKDEAENMKDYTKVVRSWSTHNYLAEGLDEVAKKIKEASNVHCDRSKLLNALAELVIENQQNLDMKHMVDHRSLIDEIAKAMKNR